VELEARLREAEERLPALEDERRSATDQLQEATREVAGLEAALKALEAQQQRLEANAKVADWAQAHGLDRAEHLWQAIHVEPGWDDAVEAALGVRLNAVKLADDSNLAALLRDAPPGNFAVFVERATAETPATSRLTPLSSTVKCPRPGVAAYVADALANVFILPEGEEGMALARVLPPGGMLVSRAGHLFSRQGVVFHGPQSELHGVLQRQREIEGLQARIPDRSQHRTGIETRLRDVEAELKEAQEAARRGRDGLAAARQADHDLEVEYLKLSQSSQQSDRRREAIREELAAIEEDEARERLEMQEAQHALETGSQAIEAIVQRLQSLEEAAKEAQRGLQAARDAIAQSERALSEARFQERSAEERAASQAQLALSLAERVQALSANRDKVSGELAQLEEGQVRERLQGALEVRRERERALAEARSGLESLSTELRTLEEGRLEVEQRLNPLRERITELRIKEQEAATHASSTSSRSPDAGSTREELAEQIEKRVRSSSLQAEINRLNEEIAALGPVNLAALSELGTATERKSFLDAQAEDLTKAVETLEAAIKRIDRETRELLQETFDAVNANFQEMFPALFGGGQASLKLTGEEILDAGLLVLAQPPGQEEPVDPAPFGRREGAHRHRARVLALPPEPRALLPPRRGGRAPRRPEHRALLRPGPPDVGADPVPLHHAQQDHHGARRTARGRDDAGAGVSRVVEVDIEAAMELARKQAA
jgi:chromosome segregation protein